jgi:hypothetical protein
VLVIRAGLKRLIRGVSAPGQAPYVWQGESPCKVRSSQPPLASVAWRAEGVFLQPTKLCEAYTAHRIGHRGRPHSPEVWYSLVSELHADDDVFNATEVNTKVSILVRDRRVCRGPQGVACPKRRMREPGRPFTLLRRKKNRRYGYPIAQRMPDGVKGVGLTHSTPRRESRSHGEGVSNVTQFVQET